MSELKFLLSIARSYFYSIPSIRWERTRCNKSPKVAINLRPCWYRRTIHPENYKQEISGASTTTADLLRTLANWLINPRNNCYPNYFTLRSCISPLNSSQGLFIKCSLANPRCWLAQRRRNIWSTYHATFVGLLHLDYSSGAFVAVSGQLNDEPTWDHRTARQPVRRVDNLHQHFLDRSRSISVNQITLLGQTQK